MEVATTMEKKKSTASSAENFSSFHLNIHVGVCKVYAIKNVFGIPANPLHTELLADIEFR